MALQQSDNINLHIQHGSNMFRIFLSCRINDEVSADAAADAAYVTTTKLLYRPSTLYIHTGDTIRLSCIRFEHCLKL